MQTRNLSRSMMDRVFGGVCGGLGDYLRVNAWWVRATFVLLAIFTLGFSIGIYLVLWLLTPPQTLADLTLPHEQRRSRAETFIILGMGVAGLGLIVLAVSLGILQGAGGDILLPFVVIGVGMILLYQQLRSVA